jgi:hypothetical protein
MHEVVGALSEVLGVELAQALGHYSATCCGFGEFRKDGRANKITDSTLEQWALWRGEPGAFATAFRAHCVETARGQKDRPGIVRGWWRQAKLLEKQVTDAARRHPPKDASDKPDKNPRGFAAGTPAGLSRNGNGSTYGTTKGEPGESAVESVRPALALEARRPEMVAPTSGDPVAFEARRAELKAQIAAAKRGGVA